MAVDTSSTLVNVSVFACNYVLRSHHSHLEYPCNPLPCFLAHLPSSSRSDKLIMRARTARLDELRLGLAHQVTMLEDCLEYKDHGKERESSRLPLSHSLFLRLTLPTHDPSSENHPPQRSG